MIRGILAVLAGLIKFALGLAAALVRAGIRYPLAGLIVLALIAAAVLSWKAMLSRHDHGWRRSVPAR